MKKENIIAVKVWLTTHGLNRVLSTPALKSLFHQNQLEKLKAGDNFLNVSKPTYSQMNRLLNTQNILLTIQHTAVEKI